MAKNNRATRKELEGVIQEIIQEVTNMKQAIRAIDNYLGAYVKFKGDALTFSQYIKDLIDENKQTENKNKKPDAVKKSRYEKVSKPPA